MQIGAVGTLCRQFFCWQKNEKREDRLRRTMLFAECEKKVFILPYFYAIALDFYFNCVYNRFAVGKSEAFSHDLGRVSKQILKSVY